MQFINSWVSFFTALYIDMIDSFEKKKLLRKVSLSELNQSRNKDDNNVREFVLSEREGLKNQINRLI